MIVLAVSDLVNKVAEQLEAEVEPLRNENNDTDKDNSKEEEEVVIMIEEEIEGANKCSFCLVCFDTSSELIMILNL